MWSRFHRLPAPAPATFSLTSFLASALSRCRRVLGLRSTIRESVFSTLNAGSNFHLFRGPRLFQARTNQRLTPGERTPDSSFRQCLGLGLGANSSLFGLEWATALAPTPFVGRSIRLLFRRPLAHFALSRFFRSQCPFGALFCFFWRGFGGVPFQASRFHRSLFCRPIHRRNSRRQCSCAPPGIR